MIRTWKCLLGTIAVCALLAGESRAQEIRSNQVGVARLRTDIPLNETQSADWLYGAEESVWLDDFQPPPGIGVDPATIPNDNSVGYAVTTNVDNILYRINRTNRHYYGLDDGFTAAQAFIPLRVMNGGTSLLAINPRMFVDDDGRGGINFGVTARRYFQSSDRILTSSMWIDYDDGHRGGYAQFGLAGSIIGRWFTTSAFANIPMGEKGQTWTQSITAGFDQNQLVINRAQLVESPYAHYQVEFAVPMPYFSRWGFEYGLGAYALASRASGVEDGFGISNRVEAQVTEDFTLNTLVTSDGVFGSNLSVNLELTLPNGMPSRMFRRPSVQSLLTRSDNRSYRVLTNTVRRVQHVTAIDPKDGEALNVAQINPNGGGSGAFSSIQEFESLPDATQSTFDIVYVLGRLDGTDTNLNTTITLFDEQQLLGTGTQHLIDTTLGVVPLVDLPFGTPVLSNSAAPGMDVVTLADWNTVSGVTIDAGGTADGINGLGLQAGEAGDPGVRGFNINRTTIQNAVVGVNINAEDTNDGTTQVGIFRDNLVSRTSDDGLRITYEDTGLPSGDLELTIVDNVFEGILAQGIDIELSGTATAEFDINNNTFAYVQENQFITGLNFTGTDINDAGFVPPDVNGDVSTEHIVELVNGAFAVYDKDTGALITRTTLDDFWINSGAVPVISPLNPTGTPRVVYDRSTNRWFATSVDGGPGNRIFVAVSNSSDPSAGWTGFAFIGDSLGVRTNIIESLGLDANGVYIATNNLGGAPVGLDVSIYSIPKADLIGATPTIANMTRFENLSSALFGIALHAAQDFGAFDGEAQLLGLSAISGTELVRVDLTNTDTPTASVSLPTTITVPPEGGSPGGGQPLAPNIFDNLSPLLASNVVEVGDSIWAVRTVAGTMGNSAVRWYEIDATTDTLVQTGLIEDAEIDFVAASIAVNPRGQVAIGFTGSSDTLDGTGLHPSSMAIMGSTAGGVTTFGTPVLLERGLGDYFVLGNQWGGYSSTVQDPQRENVFWTFQEFAPAQNEWAIQVTELISGVGGHDGIRVTARDMSTVLAGSDINNNEFFNGTGTGISLNAFDDAFINLSGTISDNVISDAGVDGMFFSVGGDGVLLVEGDRNLVTGSGRNGLTMVANGNSLTVPRSVLEVAFRNSVFDGNTERGVFGQSFGDSDLIFSLTSPVDMLATDPATASNNGFQGFKFEGADESTLTAFLEDVLVDANGDTGIAVAMFGDSVGVVDIINGTIVNTVDAPSPDYSGEGVGFRTFENSMLTAHIMDSFIEGNEGAGVTALSDGTSTLDVTIDPTIITNNGLLNMAGGVVIDRRGSSLLSAHLEELIVENNMGNGLTVLASGASTGAFPADVVITSVDNSYSLNTADGINYNLTGAANVFASHVCDIVDSNGDPMMMTGNGVSVTTNTASFFGAPPISPSVFDSLVVTNNGANGYVFTQNGGSTLIADIVSDTKPMTSLIASNTLDGVEINHAGTGGNTSIRIGNAANPAFDVTIDENLEDAVDINITGAGNADVAISNTYISGALFAGAISDPGVTIEHTGDADAEIFIGQDFSLGRVLDWTDTSVRGPVTITNIAGTGDGINLLFDPTNMPSGATHSLLVADSLIGGPSGSIGGDGVQLDVNQTGFIGRFFQNRILGTGGDGIRLVTMSENIDGGTVVVPGDPGPGGMFPDPPLTAQDGDANGNMIGDFPTAMSPFLNSLARWVPDWGDRFTPANVVADLIIGDTSLGAGFGGNVISGNADQGVELSVGGATLQNVIVRGNTLGGNTNGDFTTSTSTNTIATQTVSVDRAEGMPDDVVLDPLARLNLFFGDMAGGALSPNTGNVLLPGTTGGTWAAGDAFKPAGRAVLTDFTVTVPDEFFPPADNIFTLPVIGDQDESLIFMNNGWTVIAE